MPGFLLSSNGAMGDEGPCSAAAGRTTVVARCPVRIFVVLLASAALFVAAVACGTWIVGGDARWVRRAEVSLIVALALFALNWGWLSA